jgi:hydrogenase expression/formation protein HypD
VIQGKAEPDACALFASECTPLTPIGPCMVSSEGTCAAWYKYNRPTTAVETERSAGEADR